MKPVGIHHVNLMFDDIDAAREFYGDVMGFDEIERPDFGFPGLWFQNPATHILLRGNGRDAWFGWPSIPRLEELRDAWMESTDLATQQRIARDMQIVGMHELPCIPWARSTASPP